MKVNVSDSLDNVPPTSAMRTETVMMGDSAETTSVATAGGAETTSRPRYQTENIHHSMEISCTFN